MGACDGVLAFDPALGFLFFGFGRSVAYALGCKLYSMLGGSVALMDISVSYSLL
jgi:hypothetical protein